MRKSKFIALFLALTMCLVLMAGCGSTNGGTATTAPAATGAVADADTADARTVDNPSSDYQTYASDSTYTIGITLQNLDLESITMMKNYLEEDLTKNYPNVKYSILDAQNDQGTQLQEVETFISQGVDAVILNPVDQEGAQTAVEECVTAGIPVFTLLQKVSDMSNIAAHSGMDHTESASLSVGYGMKLINNKGNVADVEGPMGQSAQILRSKGLADILAKNTGAKLVFEETANWKRDEAMALAENWLQSGTKIDLFFCQCDNMALGVVQACEEAGADPYIVSIDGDKDGIQAIIDGKLDCTVAINYEDMCYHSIDNCIAYLDGQAYNNEYYCQLVLITADNAAKELAARYK
jgi:inositol transport system substrate-binding protein